jgi:signal recognition particle GTPase
MKPIRSPRRDRADEWQIVAQRRVFEMVLSRVNRSAAIIALVGVRGTGKTTICGQIMIKLARRWSELVQCELVGFVLLVQHQRTYASQLMSDSHEPDVVLCAEVRIDRLQRFNDFNSA